MKKLFKIFVLFAFVLFGTTTANAQEMASIDDNGIVTEFNNSENEYVNVDNVTINELKAQLFEALKNDKSAGFNRTNPANYTIHMDTYKIERNGDRIVFTWSYKKKYTKKSGFSYYIQYYEYSNDTDINEVNALTYLTGEFTKS